MFFQSKLSVVTFCGRTAVDLETEATFEGNLFVWLGKVNRLVAIKPNLDSGTFGPNDEFVPFSLWADMLL